MTPAVLQDGEVQHYASPVLVKNNQYYATLTNQRLIFEGATTREFKVISIQAVYPENIAENDPGLKLIISTPTGQRDMVLGFPLDDVYKAGEQQAWIDAIRKVIGDKPFATGTFTRASRAGSLDVTDAAESQVAGAGSTSAGCAVVPAAPQKTVAEGGASSGKNSGSGADVELMRGESVVTSTAGVRIKHTFYTIYLTNLRMILQNHLGKISREFAIAELVDAASLDSDSGEPEIAVSVGMQSGLKQMLVIYPTESSRDAWMRQFKNIIPRKNIPGASSAAKAGTAAAARVGTFVPATSERVLVTTPSVKIKNRSVIVHLTNTRFVIDSVNGIVGEFAVTALSRAIRMASEIGEPGVSLKINSPKGERDMHLIFSSLNDREAWIDALQGLIPEGDVSSSTPYSVTTVHPRTVENTQTMECPSCGAVNPASEEYCGVCGSPLHPSRSDEERVEEHAGKKRRSSRRKDTEADDDNESWSPKKSGKKRKSDDSAVEKERPEYTGGVIGFISRPRDAFQYYAHEHPKVAFPTFLLTGGIWAVLTTLVIVYLLPNIFAIDPKDYPLISSLQGDILLLVLFVIVLWVIWLVAVLVHAVITSVVAHLFEPSVKISEVLAMTMRCSLTFAVVGWIPLLGTFAASIWMAIETWFGLRITQDTSGFGAAAAAFVGMIVVYAGLFIIGGGFS